MKNKFVTPGETTEEREEFWIGLIAEARAYRGGIAKFCRDRGVGKEVYYHWFSKVKDKIESWQQPLDTNKKRRKHPVKEKTTKPISRPRPKREWKELINQWKRSGLTACAFARKNKLHKVTFCRWIRKFDGTYSEKPKHSKSQAEVFVPVVVTDNEAHEDLPEQHKRATEASVEIVLSNARLIRVLPGFDADLLKAVIQTIEAC